MSLFRKMNVLGGEVRRRCYEDLRPFKASTRVGIAGCAEPMRAADAALLRCLGEPGDVPRENPALSY